MKVEPLGQSQSEFILFILDGVGGLLLIQTFLKNREPPSVLKILKLKLEYFYFFFHLPRPFISDIVPKFYMKLDWKGRFFSIMFPL